MEYEARRRGCRRNTAGYRGHIHIVVDVGVVALLTIIILVISHGLCRPIVGGGGCVRRCRTRAAASRRRACRATWLESPPQNSLSQVARAMVVHSAAMAGVSGTPRLPRTRPPRHGRRSARRLARGRCAVYRKKRSLSGKQQVCDLNSNQFRWDRKQPPVKSSWSSDEHGVPSGAAQAPVGGKRPRET